MTTHYFFNDTEVEPIFFYQFGLSVKSAGAIGQFGTGLKYAIATILRGGGYITVTSNGNRMEFSTRNATVRNQEVSIVQMSTNGAPSTDLSFNLSLGKNWKPWMAFRELYANARDEGGDYQPHPLTAQWKTVIAVKWSEFDTINLNEYFPRFFTGDTLVQAEEMNIHYNTPEKAGKIFYKGNYVGKVKSPFTYELLSEAWQRHLTEDRTISDVTTVQYRAAEIISKIKPETFMRFVDIMMKEPSAELHWVTPPEEVLLLLANRAARGEIDNMHMLKWVEQWKNSQPPTTREATSVEQAVLDRALKILSEGGIIVTAPILISSHHYKGILGCAREGKILIEAETFKIGLRTILKTILEEHTHLTTGAVDFTYEMQHALHENWINLYCHLTGEII